MAGDGLHRRYTIENAEAVVILLRSRCSSAAGRCVDNSLRDYGLARKIAAGASFDARCVLAGQLLPGAGRQHIRNAATVAPLIAAKGTPFYLDPVRKLVICCTLTLSKTGYFAAF